MGHHPATVSIQLNTSSPEAFNGHLLTGPWTAPGLRFHMIPRAQTEKSWQQSVLLYVTLAQPTVYSLKSQLTPKHPGVLETPLKLSLENTRRSLGPGSPTSLGSLTSVQDFSGRTHTELCADFQAAPLNPGDVRSTVS